MFAKIGATAAVAALLVFQAYAYGRALPLSLGPRVILQPWLLATQGYLPYDQIVDQHTPLMPELLSLAVPFVSEGWQLARGALVALISLTLVLTYLAARRAAGSAAGIIAASCFVCWSVSFGFTKLWHESFLAVLYAGLLLLHARPGTARSLRRIIATGLLCGIAVLVKQPAAAVAAVMVTWQVVRGWRTGQRVAGIVADAAAMCAAIAAPVLAWATVHWARGGSLDAMWYWVVTFSIESPFISMAAQAPTMSEVLALAPAFAFVPASLWLGARLWRCGDVLGERYALGALLLVASLLTTYPRFAAFHLAASLPIVALLSATALVRVLGRTALVGAAALWLAAGAVAYLPVLQPGTPAIAEYSDLVPLGAAVRRVIHPAESVYVFPDDEATANLYYVLKSPPPRFWIFSYPWFMTPGARARILHTLEEHPPDWVIEPKDSWAVSHYAPDVVAWIGANYELKETVAWGAQEVKLLRRRLPRS